MQFKVRALLAVALVSAVQACMLPFCAYAYRFAARTGQRDGWNGLQENPFHFAWRSFPTSKGDGMSIGLRIAIVLACVMQVGILKRQIRRAAIAQQQEQD